MKRFSQQDEMLSQRDKLAEQNKAIDSMHMNMVAVNQNLERIVKETTESLLKQNDQLMEYTFINAHKLRAPLASILDLVNLLKIDLSEKDQKDALRHLYHSSEQLDNVVKSINRSLKKGLNLYNPENE